MPQKITQNERTRKVRRVLDTKQVGEKVIIPLKVIYIIRGFKRAHQNLPFNVTNRASTNTKTWPGNLHIYSSKHKILWLLQFFLSLSLCMVIFLEGYGSHFKSARSNRFFSVSGNEEIHWLPLSSTFWKLFSNENLLKSYPFIHS